MRWLAILFSLFALCGKPLPAKEFHVFIGGDILSKDIKKSIQQNINDMKEELATIAQATGLRMHLYEYKGQNLTSQNISLWIKSVPTHPDDIIIFYYTGHGCRVKHMKTPWPCLFFPAQNELLDSKAIMHYVRRKPNQLCIFLFDCCNVLNKERQNIALNELLERKAIMHDVREHQNMALSNSAKLPQAKISPQSKMMFQKLFANTKGVILATGSTPGRYSVAVEHGSLFTNAFIQALEKERKEAAPTWAHVFQKTSSQVVAWEPDQVPLIDLQISP